MTERSGSTSEESRRNTLHRSTETENTKKNEGDEGKRLTGLTGDGVDDASSLNKANVGMEWRVQLE